MASSSKRRQEGREAFMPNQSRLELLGLCPYKTGFLIDSKTHDWIEGWLEEEVKYLTQQYQKDCLSDLTLSVANFCTNCGEPIK